MKKILFALFCIIVLQISTFAATVTVPAGTIVPFSYDIKVSSQKIQPDEEIPITIVRDVYVGDKLIFKRGAKGYLVVFDARKVKIWNMAEYKKGGLIDIEDGMVADINGTMRNIRYKNYQKGRDLAPAYITNSYNYANIALPNNISNQNINMNNTGFSSTRQAGFGGESVYIPQGTRDKAVIPQDFQIEVD